MKSVTQLTWGKDQRNDFPNLKTLERRLNSDWRNTECCWKPSANTCSFFLLTGVKLKALELIIVSADMAFIPHSVAILDIFYSISCRIDDSPEVPVMSLIWWPAGSNSQRPGSRHTMSFCFITINFSYASGMALGMVMSVIISTKSYIQGRPLHAALQTFQGNTVNATKAESSCGLTCSLQ